MQSLARDFTAFGGLEERNPDEVHAKENKYNEMRGPDSDWWERKTACDLWSYAFFASLQMPGTDGLDSVPTTDDVRKAVHQPAGSNGKLVGRAVQSSSELGFFHWPMEFPEVFDAGGFDVVLGNPPWERIKLQEKEFFETRDREVAQAPNKAARDRLIRALPLQNPSLAKDFADAVHGAESSSRFIRGSNRVPLTGRGDINTYSIFAETARTLCNPRGRVGMIVPSGIATDDTTKVFFSNLIDNRSLVSLYDFENREKVFQGIDSRIKFCLLTLTGKERPSAEAEFAFFLYRAEQLQDAERRFTLAPEDFALFNPNTRTCPVFRTRRDAEIAGKMYRRSGVFWKEVREGELEHNPWGIRFQRMFDMSNDSNLFRTREQLEAESWNLEGNVFKKGKEQYLPLYEAKLFHQFDHRFATFQGADKHALIGGNAQDLSAEEKKNPTTVIIPRYWVPEGEVIKRLDKQGNEDDNLDGQAIASQFGSSPEEQTHGQHSAPFYRATDWGTKEQLSESGLEPGLTTYHDGNQPADYDNGLDSTNSPCAQGRRYLNRRWLISIRKTTRGTDQRTSIASFVPRVGMSDRSPLIHLTIAEKAALLVAGLNSIVLDFATRTAIGGTDLSYFIIKQLPVLPPDAYLGESQPGLTWTELVIPRVLELTYTGWDLRSFAEDLGYQGKPFSWDEQRRHSLKCELDAIYAHMYHLDRDDLQWILDAPAPSASFPGLKRNEIQQFGEYRTQRYVLQAYDQLARGELPDLND